MRVEKFVQRMCSATRAPAADGDGWNALIHVDIRIR
jgi:hypothetical protein